MDKIKWLGWGKEAFKKSKKENKPILLDIFGTWCYWCHRMDKDTYEYPEVVKKINEHFIPIRVDTDKRPDINERYNQGGWPTTAFLSDEGKIIVGGTYIPPKNMLSILDRIRYDYQEEKLHARIQSLPVLKSKKPINESIVLELGNALLKSHDTVFGGFGTNQKFPMTEGLELALILFNKKKDTEYLSVVENSLKGMIKGIFDKVEGGFFRYSVTRDWEEPHYEKMPVTNAELVGILTQAYSITKNKTYLETATKTIQYMFMTLANPKGGIYGSQDADGEEAYYGLSLADRKKKTIPSVDKTVYSDLNGKVVLAFLKYYEITKDKKVKTFVEKTIDLLLKKYYSKQKGMAHYFDSNPHFLGLLSDHVNIALSLAKGFVVLRNKTYLEKAKELTEFILNNFWDRENSGFFDRMKQSEDIGMLNVKEKKLPDNSRVSLLLMEMYELTKNSQYKKVAKDSLDLFSETYKNYSIFASVYALAVDRVLNA